MSEMNRRILIVDDNADIHNDFKKNTDRKRSALQDAFAIH